MAHSRDSPHDFSYKKDNNIMSVSRKFPTDLLKDLLWDEEIVQDGKKYVQIENNLIDKSRWSLHYELVFSLQEEDEGDTTYWIVDYSRGATEIQDEGPFADEGDEVSCDQAYPMEVTTIQYRRI
jgi:hypothetical protein